MARSPHSSSSPPARPRLDSLMPHPSTAPLPGNDAAIDPSPGRETEAALRKSAPEDSKDIRSGFILDSGAAVHATGNAELLSESRPPGAGGASFRTRVGKDLAVAAVVSISTPRFAVPDVHLVPGLRYRRTVVSVRQLARRGLAVTFGSDCCIIKAQSTGAVVGEGRLRDEDGFYYLDYLRVPQS
uniref:Uncharacterized protein n=1 Tax=Arundo donax TaxID=35708 RepID=A0A0A8Z7K0_ARUDO